MPLQGLAKKDFAVDVAAILLDGSRIAATHANFTTSVFAEHCSVSARGYPLVQVSDPSIPPHVSPSGSVETYHPEADGPNSFDAVDEDSVTDSHDLNTCSQGTAPPRWHSAQRPAVPLNLAPYNGSCRHRLHYVTTM